MPIGLTYAEIVVGIIGAIYFGEPKPVDQVPTGTAITIGANVKNEHGPAQDGIVTFTRYGTTRVWDQYTPVYGFGASLDGAVFASYGLGKQINVLGGTLTPFTGPAIYQRNINDGFSGEELVQFRTGVDFSYPVGPNALLTAGWYHMSNMKLNDSSAEIDVTHAGLLVHF